MGDIYAKAGQRKEEIVSRDGDRGWKQDLKGGEQSSALTIAALFHDKRKGALISIYDESMFHGLRNRWLNPGEVWQVERISEEVVVRHERE